MQRRRIYTIATLIWVAVIFTFSLQPGEVSGDISGSFLYKILQTFVPGMYDKLLTYSPEQLELFHTVLRKCAHFSEFMILGILSTLTIVHTEFRRKGLWAVCFCVAVAMSDETIQLFIDGRAGRVMDVLIDSSGALVGSGCVIAAKRK